MLAPSRQGQPWIQWHGWSDDGNVACIVLVSQESATVWSNHRIVTGRLKAFVDLWAWYSVTHGAHCDILFDHELDALRD